MRKALIYIIEKTTARNVGALVVLGNLIYVFFVEVSMIYLVKFATVLVAFAYFEICNLVDEIKKKQTLNIDNTIVIDKLEVNTDADVTSIKAIKKEQKN